MTHIQLDEMTSQISSALIHLKITLPETPIEERPRGSIYADTSLNWQLFSQSFARLGITITTAYTTLGQDGLITSLVEPNVQVVFAGGGQIEMIHRVIGQCANVKWVFYDGEDRIDQVGTRKIFLLPRSSKGPWDYISNTQGGVQG